MALVVSRKRPRGDFFAGDSRAMVRSRGPRIGTVVSVPRAIAQRVVYPGRSRAASQRRGALPVETKYFDTSQSFSAGSGADWTGTEVVCTNYIQSDGTTVGAYTDASLIPSAIGSGYGQIVGNRYLLKKLRCRGQIATAALQDQVDVRAPPTVRICLVMDTQPNGSQAQGEDVFPDMGSAIQNVFSYMAMGAGSSGRFRVLKDVIIAMTSTGTGTDGASTTSVNCNPVLYDFTYAPSKPLKIAVKANSATPTVASQSDTNIFLLAHGSGNDAFAITVTGCARAYYCE